MLVDIVLAALAFYLSIPLIAGYFAHCYGRSFWTWFLIGCVLPIVAHFVLIGLVYFDELKAGPNKLTRREEAEAERLVQQLISTLPQLEPQNKRKINR